MFITFEGCEGCGKTTHIGLLAEYLQKTGKAVLVSREPGGTDFGEQLREILLDARQRLSDRAEIFLFAADRAQHVQNVLQPALEKGKVVLCDRYVDSTYAYQIGGRRLPEDLVNYVIDMSSYGLMPDLTFFLDLPIAEGLKRVADRKETVTRFEQEEKDFHERVRQSFLQLAKASPKRIKVIDAAGSIENTQKQIQKYVAEVI